MAAGQFVFPVVIVGLLGYLGMFLVSTPAQDPLPPLAERTMQVEPGDRVTIELSAFYGRPGASFVFYTTQEEIAASLPRGPVEPGYDPVLTFDIPAEPGAPFELPALVLGHRVGDRFTTPVIPARDSLVGEWETRKSINRTHTTFPIEERKDDINVTQYAARMRALGIQLEPGTLWRCEGELWQCRVVSIDYDGNVLVFKRVVSGGAQFPLAALMRVSEVRGEANWNFTVVETTTEAFKIRLDPPVGNRFQLRDDLTHELRVGTYEVVAVDGAAIHANYTAAANMHPALVGQPTYYDIVVVRISRPEAG